MGPPATNQSQGSPRLTDIRAGEDQGRRHMAPHNDATPNRDGDTASPSTTSPYGSDSSSSDSDKGAAKHQVTRNQRNLHRNVGTGSQASSPMMNDPKALLLINSGSATVR